MPALFWMHVTKIHVLLDIHWDTIFSLSVCQFEQESGPLSTLLYPFISQTQPYCELFHNQRG